mgnify:CR=1 FL=1
MQYKKLGLYIRNKRRFQNKKLNDIVIENDIEPAILSRVENLKQDIKLGVIIKIAKGFNLSPAEFLAEFESFDENL